MRLKKNLKVSGYGVFKQTVAEAIAKELEPFQKKYNELMNNQKLLDEIYLKGAKKAKEIASKTLDEVYRKVGLIRGF